VLLKQLSVYRPWWDTPKKRQLITEENDSETIIENKTVVDWPCPLQNLPGLETVCKRIPDNTLFFNIIAAL
jgi:hypothetical protein